MSEILPNEIILKIVNLIPKESRVDSLRHLRLASKRLSVLVSPILFHKFSVSANMAPKRGKCSAITSDLETRRTTVFENVRRARIAMLSAGRSVEECLPWLNLLDLLIPTMKNLDSIEWYYYPSDRYPPERIANYVTLLSSIPSLKHFSVALSGNGARHLPPEFSLEPFSHLHHLSVVWADFERPESGLLSQISRLLTRCPELEIFSFSIRPPFYPNPYIKLKEIFAHFSSLPLDACLRIRQLKVDTLVVTGKDFQTHLRHFRYLQTLKIKSDPSPSSATQIGIICALLQHENIFVKEIAIDAIHPPQVLDYLLSCSDMEHIQLVPRHVLDDSPNLVNQFFSVVLPRHSHSLKSLEIGAPTSKWTHPLSNEQFEEIAKCQSLQYLCYYMFVTSADVVNRNQGILRAWLKLAMRLPRLQRFKCPAVLVRKLVVDGNFQHYEGLPVDQDPDPAIQKFVAEVVEGFKRYYEVDFHINYHWNC